MRRSIVFLLIFAMLLQAIPATAFSGGPVFQEGALDNVLSNRVQEHVDEVSSLPTNIPLSYDDLLLVYNDNSQMSIDIKNYYVARRPIPTENICNITTSTAETVSRSIFTNEIRKPIESCIVDGGLLDTINYIVTTKGVPLRVTGSNAAVDSELTLILGPYNASIGSSGSFDNPYFNEEGPFTHAEYGTYIVTRLTAYTLAEVKNLIDLANNSTGSRGIFQMDAGGPYGTGDQWILAANKTMVDKGYNVTLDNTNTFTMDHKNVMGHVSWGSNGRGYGSNFVPNSGFETDADSNTIPDGWVIVNDGGSWGRSSDTAYSGTYSAKIVRPVVTADASEIGHYINITPNTRYWVSGYANLSSVSNDGGAHLFIKAYDAQDQFVTQINASSRSGDRNWYGMSQVHYEPIQGVSKVMVGAALSKSSGTAYFDAVALHVIRPNNTWVPGAIAETFVSTGGRSYTYGTSYGQSLIADMVREGVSGVSSHVFEPYLTACGRPQILFDRYTSGYTMGESFAMALPWIGWMETVVGDPKMVPYWDLPDPMVTNISMSPTDPAVGEEVTFNAQISNRGGDATNVDLEFYLGDPLGGNQLGTTKTFPTLARDETRTFEIKHTFTDDLSFRVFATVDNSDTIMEQRETNNKMSVQFKVETKPDLEITPLDLVFSSSDILQGDVVNLNISASNNGGTPTNMTASVNITELNGTYADLRTVNVDPVMGHSSVTALDLDIDTTNISGDLCAEVVLSSSRLEDTVLNNQASSCVFVKVQGFSVEQLTSELEVPPLDSMFHSFNVTNLGNVDDDFIITYTTSDSIWAVDVNPQTLTLGPGESATVLVKTWASVGLGFADVLSVNVSITSVNSASSRDLTFISRVGPRFGITVEMGDIEAEALPGTDVFFDITIGNLGNAQDNISILSDAPANWTVAMDQVTTTLAPGYFVVRTATVTVGDDALANAYETITFTASSENGATDITADTFVSVLQSYNVSTQVDIVSPLSLGYGDSGTGTISVTNNGNGDDDVTIEVRAPPGLLATTNRSKFTLREHDVSTTTLSITASDIIEPGVHTITIGTEDEAQIKAEIEIDVHVIMPDLDIERSFLEKTNSPIKVGDVLVYDVHIRNIGNAPSGRFNISFKAGAQVIEEEVVESMDPDATISRSYKWEAKAGSWQIVIDVDGDNKVIESNEVNNKFSDDLIIEKASTGGGAGTSVLQPWMLVVLIVVVCSVYLVAKVSYWSRKLKSAAAQGESKRAAEREAALAQGRGSDTLSGPPMDVTGPNGPAGSTEVMEDTSSGPESSVGATPKEPPRPPTISTDQGLSKDAPVVLGPTQEEGSLKTESPKTESPKAETARENSPGSNKDGEDDELDDQLSEIDDLMDSLKNL